MESYSAEILKKSLHDTIDNLCGYPVDLITDYNTEGIRLFKFMKKVLKDLMSVTPDLDPVTFPQVSQKLMSDYACSAEVAQDLAGQFLIRRKDVQNYMSQALLSESSLSSFNWSISLVLSSSLKAEMKEPLLHLHLNTMNGFDTSLILLEFNYPELCSFLEKIGELRDKCLGY